MVVQIQLFHSTNQEAATPTANEVSSFRQVPEKFCKFRQGVTIADLWLPLSVYNPAAYAIGCGIGSTVVKKCKATESLTTTQWPSVRGLTQERFVVPPVKFRHNLRSPAAGARRNPQTTYKYYLYKYKLLSTSKSRTSTEFKTRVSPLQSGHQRVARRIGHVGEKTARTRETPPVKSFGPARSGFAQRQISNATINAFGRSNEGLSGGWSARV